MEQQRETIGTSAAGRRLGVSHDTIRNYWQAGKLQGFRMNGLPRGRLMIYVDSLDEFDRQRREGGVKPMS